MANVSIIAATIVATINNAKVKVINLLDLLSSNTTIAILARIIAAITATT